MENKRGPWSEDDKDYIEANCVDKTPDQIAKDLHRNPEAVKKYMKKKGLLNKKILPKEVIDYEYDIKRSSHWKILKNQFSPKELEYFEYHWNNIIRQFGDDVLHTEEIQVIDYIKLEILLGRLLTKQKETDDDIMRLESLLLFEQNKSDDDKDKGEIDRLGRQISFAKASLEAIGKEFRDMLNEKNKILRDMKATREARVKSIESSKESMNGWMKKLIQDKPLRKQLGIEMEKMRLATIVEIERLSDWYKYEDGIIDQPFLTPQTVKEDDE